MNAAIDRPVVVGHRGAARLAPENTLRSFRRAIADGAAAIECDVHLSADGHVVVMHDESVDRTADPESPVRTGDIGDLTRAELDRVVLDGGEKVPSLEEFLDVAQTAGERPVGVLVEVKVPEAARAAALQLRERFGASPQPLPDGTPPAVVISFHPEALATVREVAPGIPLGYLVVVTEESVFSTLAELGAERLSVWIEGVADDDAARAAEASAASLHVWTVNTPEQLRRAVEVGAESVTTDDPAWAAGERDRLLTSV